MSERTDPAFDRALKEIDPGLDVRWDPRISRFKCWYKGRAGGTYFVCTIENPDGSYQKPGVRFLDYLRNIDGWAHPRWSDAQKSIVEGILRQIEQQRRLEDHEGTENLGEAGQQLAWAMKKQKALGLS